MFRNRKALLLLLVGIAALVVIYALFYSPDGRANGSRAKEELRELEALVQANQIQLTNYRTAIHEVLGDRVPVYPLSEKSWSQWRTELIRNLDALVRDTNVALSRFEPEESEERSYQVLHPFSLEFKGAFPAICRFIQGLEGDLRLIPEQWGLEVASREGDQLILQASCTAVAYEWRGEVLSLPPWGKWEGEAFQLALARDPFVDPDSIAARTKPTARQPKLVLTGILNFRGKRKAIINGKPYEAGDTLGGKRIISITDDEVAIEGEPQPLKIQRSRQVIPPS
jgi:Tfp pilus assembly protein PilO